MRKEKKPIKLHLGCGNHRLEGYININIEKSKAVDLVHDVTKPLPFEDNSVDRIFSHHLIEHIEEPHKLCKDWYRVLKPGGECEINTPDMDGIAKDWLNPEGKYNKEHFKNTGEYREHLVKMLFGSGPGYMAHHTILWPEKIKEILEEVGFVDIKVEKQNQCLGPSMKVTTVKGN